MENITIGWPQGIFIVIIFLKFIILVAKANGWRPVDKSTDAAYAVTCFTYPMITVGLLYWGGFFTS